VYICDECVEVCVDVIREGHKTVFVSWAHRDH
jgi:ATP-dependent protease Clp ATPase subunit